MLFFVQRSVLLSLEMILNLNEVKCDVHSAWNTLIWVFMIYLYIFVVKNITVPFNQNKTS